MNMNMNMNINNTPIFRFKFTPEFNSHLLSFSKLHQYDDRVTYKEEWDKWVLCNDSIIHNETMYLKSTGYDGDILQKMYKSGRYYFRKKTFTDHEPKQRRKYISIDKDIIDLMDRNIILHVETSSIFKPAISYEKFCLDHSSMILDETQRLIELDLNRADITNKLKKTYKNRYFLFKDNYDSKCHCRDDDRIDDRIDNPVEKRSDEPMKIITEN